MLVVAAAWPRATLAQLDPSLRWRTLRTVHFRVHYSPGLEPLARRSAVYAETAWQQLARELHPPRGPVELVVADNVDFTNGFATVFPSNRIVIYAQPPVAMRELRFYEDWAQLVITHELLHIFHIDRSRGIWRLGQRLLGRHPALFPNAYLPSWVKEGLAVHYETKLTGAGRLASTEFPMIARTAALDGRIPSSTDWSLATTEYPLGNTAYAYGSLMMQWLIDHAADSGSTRRFVDRTAVWPVPYVVSPAARRAFGTPVSAAYRAWRDSVRGSVAAASPALAPATQANWLAEYPRWRDDSTLIVAMQPAQQMPGLYAVDVRTSASGASMLRAPRRIARRNSLDANAPLADGSIIYAQFEPVDPFTLRSDLWIEVDGVERRLTHGARLSHPDVPPSDRRETARILAVQSVDGSTRIVRVSPAGDSIVAVTRAHPDTQWAEPRWRADGRGFAAVRLTRGGRSAVVLFDASARERAIVGEARGVLGAPQWVDDGRVLFHADASGVTQLYEARVTLDQCDAATPCRVPLDDARVRVLTASARGAFQPSVGPRGELVALHFRLRGFEVVHVRGAYDSIAMPRGDELALRMVHYDQRVQSPVAPAVDSSRTRAYAPWRLLLPTYWTPVIGQSALGSAVVGAATSGVDVIGRHAWSAYAAVPTVRPDVEGTLTYRYRGFGQPVLDLSGTQGWDYFGIFGRAPRTPGSADSVTTQIGELRRVSRIAGAALTMVRPGLRQAGSLSLGASLEQRDFASDPAPLIGRLAPLLRTRPIYPAFTASGVWSTVQQPGRAVSLEDGVIVSASAQRRWRSGADSATGSTRVVGSVRGFKSLPFGGFARHVVAARVAGAWNDRRASSDVSIGGASGAQVELLPGVTVGDPTRTFPVRGFAPGAQRGLSAAAGSVEYRAPLAAIARGLGRLPVFLDRAGVSLFGDAARAWCPAGDRSVVCAGTRAQDDWLASVGAELSLVAGVSYDQPYRFRFGVAQRVRASNGVGTGAAVYVTLGSAF
ncbi:MAG: hypothetical protein MUE41_06905 [Gemmatimonadaceae bacterium]|nr:hypothetical protein [Gemmatimonadaceae bacterium]